MFRRTFLAMFSLLAAPVPRAADKDQDEAIWRRLKQGGHIILLRHALTDEGIGDPPGFRLGACSTQRNLSATGREDARQVGAAFRNRDIPLGPILSSRWCRCIDTAQLAYGRVEPAPMLDSMFGEPGAVRAPKIRQVMAYIAAYKQPGNLVLVTHDANIRAMTGEAVAAGAMLVTVPGQSRLEVVARLAAHGRRAK
jgi:broad specificity phosphatase PhoE